MCFLQLLLRLLPLINKPVDHLLLSFAYFRLAVLALSSRTVVVLIPALLALCLLVYGQVLLRVRLVRIMKIFINIFLIGLALATIKSHDLSAQRIDFGLEFVAVGLQDRLGLRLVLEIVVFLDISHIQILATFPTVGKAIRALVDFGKILERLNLLDS